MFKGKTDQPWFLMPLLHTDTVGDAIVQQVLSGYGKTVFLPGFMGLMPIAVSSLFLIGGEGIMMEGGG